MAMELSSLTPWSFDIDMHRQILKEYLCSYCRINPQNIEVKNNTDTENDIKPCDIDDICSQLNRCRTSGLEPFAENVLDLFSEVRAMENLHFSVRRKIVFAHKNFEFVRDAISEIGDHGKQRFAVVTGLMLHEKLHLGHKCVIDQLKWYQEKGADIFIALSDVESWIKNKRKMSVVIKDAMENHLLSYFALGIKPISRSCQIYSQWARREIFCTALTMSGAVDYSKWRKKWKIAEENMNLGKVFFPFIVAADILHAQMEKFGGKRPTVVPVGIDQYGYLNVATSLIERYNTLFSPDDKYYPPSVTYNRLLVGTDMKPMDTESGNAIFLSDSPDVVSWKLMRAVTGGRRNLEEQKRLGGDPRKCAPYEMYKFNHPDDRAVKRIFVDCVTGGTSCFDCKNRIIDYFKDILEDFQLNKKKFEGSEDILKFMLTQDILRESESITEITNIQGV
jgi:tryptophanyl-tRNA synthetase